MIGQTLPLTPIKYYLSVPRLCPDGGIGIRARLKIVSRKGCGFDPHSGHIFMKSSKTLLLIGFLILILICIGYSFYSFALISNQNPIEIEAVEALTSEEYREIKADLLSHLETHNPHEVLTYLASRADQDPKISRACHELTHEVGHAAFEKLQDVGKALEYMDEFCNSGYVHGIIEEYFEKTPDINTILETMCSAYKDGTFRAWQCYHGIGHGLMYYTSNDLPTSINHCKKLPTSFQQQTCINGIYMENFNTSMTAHPSEYLPQDDSFYPCSPQGESPEYCYLYAPTYYLNNKTHSYTDALNWCLYAPGEFKYICGAGVGYEVIKQNMLDPKKAEAACESGPHELQDFCIRGMVGSYIFYTGNTTDVQSLCPTLNQINKKSCITAINENSYLFTIN